MLRRKRFASFFSVCPVCFVDCESRDAGSLLSRAGLNLPTVDIDTFTVRYADMFAVAEHIRTMGESNAAMHRRGGPMPRDTALAAAAIYSAMFGYEDGSVPSQFQVLYMAGW